MPFDPVSFALGFAAAIILLFAYGGLLFLILPFLRGFLCGAPISLMYVLGMRLRGSPVKLLMDAFISLRQSGYQHVRMRDVESLYLIHRGRIVTMQDLVELVRVQHPLPEAAPIAERSTS